MRPRAAGFLVALEALAIATAVAPLSAQHLVRGQVVAAEDGTPIADALVRTTRSSGLARSDRVGNFAVPVTHWPDTVVIAAIGRRPDSVPLVRGSVARLRVALAAAPVTLADLVVVGAPAPDPAVAELGRWSLSREAVRLLPPAVEPDPLRSLSLVPGVAFSSPLSARPLLRGYDAGETTQRIDGFEVLNLYHIGRAFSAVPADAVDRVTVQTAPHATGLGGGLAGGVDIAGRVGSDRLGHAGASLSLGSASAWAGDGGAFRWFGAARAVHFSVFDAVADTRIPYDFQDVYGSVLLGDSTGARARVTVFGSRDDLLDRDEGSGMSWSNVLVGGRWYFRPGGRWVGESWASLSRFAEDVSDIPARHSRLDVRNRFDRLAAGTDWSRIGPTTRLGFGFGVGWRGIENRILSRAGDEFVATDASDRRPEFAGYGEWAARFGEVTLLFGARVDATWDALLLQPRARVRVPVASGVAVGFAAGRTGRLYHLVSDPQAEPDLTFYDFWLDAGRAGVPVARADHVALDVELEHGPVTGRAAIYASQADGLMELRPETDQRVGMAPFRIGRARTAGLEVQAALAGATLGAGTLSVLYALNRSDRSWDGNWIPWSQERRHTVRVFGETRSRSGWRLFGAVELASGMPVTPVEQVIFVEDPSPIDRDERSPFGRPAYLYGAENSTRGPMTVRVDLGTEFRFAGPWSSRMTVGLSVINAGFGRVSRTVPVAPEELFASRDGRPPLGRVAYEPLFELPAVPTATVRMEF